MRFESHLGHVFSLFRGLWAAECVQISFYGLLRGPFLLVAVAVWRLLLLTWTSGVAAYSFMVGSAWNCMTRCELGSNSHVHPCRSRYSWETLGVTSMMFSSIGQRPGEPTGFGDDQGAAGPDSRQGVVQSRPFLFRPVTPWSPSGHWGRLAPYAPCTALPSPVRWIPDAADDLRGRGHLSRLSNLGGTVLRPGSMRIQDSSICIDFSQRQCGRRMSRWGTGLRAQ
jgi:hypothetical protein